MNIFIWIIVGYIIGWVAPGIFKNNTDKNMLMYLILGIAGSLIGGYLTTSMFTANLASISSLSALTASLGAVIFIIFGRKCDKI